MLRILILGRKSASTHLLIHTLQTNGNEIFWYEEKRDDKISLLKRRIKRLGLLTVIGQVLFQIFQKFLTYFSKKRLMELGGVYKNITSNRKTNNINSVNFTEEGLADFDLVILSGTRILIPEIIACFKGRVINIHAGITPKYRGVHGGYWSLVNNEPEIFGATIHFVDSGIDTGSVIRYSYSKPSTQDNFSTYPLLQQLGAVKILMPILPGIINGSIEMDEGKNIESKVWSHPTIWSYLYFYARFGIK